MSPLIQSVRDLKSEQDILRARSYGMIEVSRGVFSRVVLRPWPKIGSIVEAKWISAWKNSHRPCDHCKLFYNQPLGHRQFLALTYIESTWKTSLKTVQTALNVLDCIAYLKQSKAMLAEVSNDRISDRLLRRFGWEPHLENRRGRHYIKRFWGKFPETAVQQMAHGDSQSVPTASTFRSCE